jgi:hypothetical protein
MVVLRARAARDCRKGVLAKRSSKQSPLIAPRGSISERSKRDCAHRSNHDDSYLNERAFIVRFNHDDYHNLLCIGYARCSIESGTSPPKRRPSKSLALPRSASIPITAGPGPTARGVKLAPGASVYDLADPMGKMFFNIFAEFDADLIRMRTREGMAVARAKGKLSVKQPKLSDKQQNKLRRMRDTGDYSISCQTVTNLAWNQRASLESRINGIWES